MKKKILIFLIGIMILSLTGCGIKYPELGHNSIGFEMFDFYDENNNDEGYLAIEYNGRIYIPFGTLKNSINEKDIDECVGYIVQDGTSSSIVNLDDKDTRIFTLIEDKDNNFLMEYYIATTLMNPHIFYRAVDTKDKDIVIPNYIDDLDYSYWK